MLKVSRHDLLFALENRSPGTAHYLDAASGAVIPVFGFNRQRILAEVRADPDRYIRLAPLSGVEGYKAMEDFARTVSRTDARTRLVAALREAHVFRSFRAVLDTLPGELDRWLGFRAEYAVNAIRRQLGAAGVTLELTED